jgi:hypothetical protein
MGMVQWIATTPALPFHGVPDVAKAYIRSSTTVGLRDVERVARPSQIEPRLIQIERSSGSHTPPWVPERQF